MPGPEQGRKPTEDLRNIANIDVIPFAYDRNGTVLLARGEHELSMACLVMPDNRVILVIPNQSENEDEEPSYRVTRFDSGKDALEKVFEEVSEWKTELDPDVAINVTSYMFDTSIPVYIKGDGHKAEEEEVIARAQRYRQLEESGMRIPAWQLYSAAMSKAYSLQN